MNINDCGDCSIFPKSYILPVKARDLDSGINNLVAIWDLLIQKLVHGAYEFDKLERPHFPSILLPCSQMKE